jgi:predicted transposase/invertase (TIGR01784 family)
MRTDPLFFKIFQILPTFFFTLLGLDPGAGQGYEFSSVEIKQTSFRVDALFRPPQGAVGKPLYFAEVQFQPRADFYWRFFAEVILYLEQEKPDCDSVAIFARRSLDPGVPFQLRSLQAQHLKVIYLDELDPAEDLSTGLGIVQLIVAPQARAAEAGRAMFHRLREERDAGTISPEIIEFVETVLVYKFPQISREEMESMFDLDDLKHTRIYQEALQEGRAEGQLKGKLETVPLLISMGLTVEQIARELDLDLELVRLAASRRRNGAGNGSGNGAGNDHSNR